MAVTVNGHPIMESEFEKVYKAAVLDRPGGQKSTAAQMETQRRRYRPILLNALVEHELLVPEMAEAKIQVTDAELYEELGKGLKAYLARTGTTRADYEERVLARYGKTLKEFYDAQVANP
ncbi:MAG: SurA N-terminal domain-containing protein, partial [Planctomycetota bacterium]